MQRPLKVKGRLTLAYIPAQKKKKRALKERCRRENGPRTRSYAKTSIKRKTQTECMRCCKQATGLANVKRKGKRRSEKGAKTPQRAHQGKKKRKVMNMGRVWGRVEKDLK